MSGSFQVTQTSAYTGAPYGHGGLVRVAIPEPLVAWLVELCVLRGVPLHYLVPDPALLPAESLRFVTVDPALVAQLVDGALSAAALGGGDLELGRQFRAGVFRRLACELDWRSFFDANPTWTVPGRPDRAAAYAERWDQEHPAGAGEPRPWNGTIAGVLIRSELVRRYPAMIVRAAAAGTPLGCVRRELLAPTVMLVLFHGATPPDRIELQEPDEGVRFGAEVPLAGSGLEVDYRAPTGIQSGVVADRLAWRLREDRSAMAPVEIEETP